jgi:PEP-CTERM motif
MLFTLLLGTAVLADTIYTYTGNPFTQFSGGATCPPVCSLSGSFTLEQPLPPHHGFDILFTPLSFSFTDGSTTINQLGPVDLFGVHTDSQGVPDMWMIDVVSQSGASFASRNSQLSGDQSCLNGCVVRASEEFNPGTWSVSPEPSSLLLLGSGILGLVLSRKFIYLRRIISSSKLLNDLGTTRS